MYDFAIIGGGISGLSSAMYASRLGLSTIIFTKMPGGLITTTNMVENWPGIKQISGQDLALSLIDHAKVSGSEIKNENVNKIFFKDKIFQIVTSSNTYEAKSVLFATGTEHRRLDVKGEKEFENKGVSFCALCDGGFFKNKTVCVVGGGDSASKEALFLSEHAQKVYIIVRRDILRAEPINAERIKQNNKIEILYKSEIEEIFGENKVQKIRFKEGEGKYSGKDLEMDGIFLAIGHIAQTELAKELGVQLNNKEEIIINRHAQTNVAGVFAAGDCTDTEFKQAITGSAEGVTAAYYAYHYVNENASF
ncbi:MAG: FAD-dependent oxidoreductase [Candidatus Gracilibacteria bacterium]|jgi:thioredoxin reductase (NADPH)